MRGRVLITREPKRAAELITALSRDGINAVAEPVTYTERIAEAGSLPDLSRLDWIAFTSVNAVEAFAAILSESGLTLPGDIRIAAVGPTTALAVKRHLQSRMIVTGNGGGIELAATILVESRRSRDFAVLWPCASNAMPDLAAALDGAGVTVIEWPVYSNVPVPPAILRSRLDLPTSFDVVVLSAPSSVKSLRVAWPEPWTFTTVAIGDTTAGAIATFAPTRCITSRTPSVADMVDAIKAALDIDAEKLSSINSQERT